MRFKIINSKKAFSLVELLITACILGLALSGLLVLFSNVMVLNQTTQHQFNGLNHAEFVMEDIKHTDFANIASQITAGNWNWNATAITAHGLSPLVNEQIVTTVSGTDLLTVIVTVSWMDQGNKLRSLSLTTKMVAQ